MALWLTPRSWTKQVDVPRIEAALKAAEQRTSGELRVSVAPRTAAVA